MKNKIIQDYGKTITPELYINALQGHPYIPQADQCILNVVKKHFYPNSEVRIIDLGCGPGRLTWRLAQSTNGGVMGLDISPDFIDYAKRTPINQLSRIEGWVRFNCIDFAKDFQNENSKWIDVRYGLIDCIIMQGVMHHIHGEDRAKFLQRSFDLLKPGGVLIIGDEFIKDYESEDERIMHVAKFYLHIIDEANKGGFDELAEEEAKNLIDDCFSGTKYAGYASQHVFHSIIYPYAKSINEMFYTRGSVGGLNFEANNQICKMFEHIKRRTEHLTEASSEQNFNRGDYKVSINVFAEELSLYGFNLKEKYEIGPVQQLGGMGF